MYKAPYFEQVLECIEELAFDDNLHVIEARADDIGSTIAWHPVTSEEIAELLVITNFQTFLFTKKLQNQPGQLQFVTGLKLDLFGVLCSKQIITCIYGLVEACPIYVLCMLQFYALQCVKNES